MNMERGGQVLLPVMVSVAVVVAAALTAEAAQGARTYIVLTSEVDRPSLFSNTEGWYDSLVSHKSKMLYRYQNVMHAFSATLTQQEAAHMATQPGIISVLPDIEYQLHTTRSPQFLGLGRAFSSHAASAGPLWKASRQGRGVIVGIFDTGIWPESPSFRDAGMPPPPPRWKGRCHSKNFNFTCNNKIIGARFYSKGYKAAVAAGVNSSRLSFSPRDTNGHGSHTAATAVGARVVKSSLHGFALGTAVGMAPKAWLAVYKVCWLTCFGADIIAGLDDATADGVNVLSLSLGFKSVVQYYQNPLAIGTFGALRRGIFVAASAGNSGPGLSTVQNSAPWITTVAASTLDRYFPVNATTGDGHTFQGQAMYIAQPLPKPQYPLIYGAGTAKASFCNKGTLDPARVAGKIVVCDRGDRIGRIEKGVVVKAAGGVGMILMSNAPDGGSDLAELHVLPAVSLGYNDGVALKKYMSSTPNATASISAPGGTVIGKKAAPTMAGFSSRGPNPVTQHLLKPDVTAPGVSILAAWSPLTYPYETVNVISGTSMSCPHVSGVAALLKAAHPDWSPAAIRSALMTTATTLDKDGRPIRYAGTEGNVEATAYAYGSGHIEPNRALEPGLVYDVGEAEYFEFLCALNYTAKQREVVAWQPVRCNSANTVRSVGDLNYPSLSAVFREDRRQVTYVRTLSNVANTGSTYGVRVLVPKAVAVTVEPAHLRFEKKGDKRSFRVTMRVRSLKALRKAPAALFGRVEWSDGRHLVRTPIAFSTPLFQH